MYKRQGYDVGSEKLDENLKKIKEKYVAEDVTATCRMGFNKEQDKKLADTDQTLCDDAAAICAFLDSNFMGLGNTTCESYKAPLDRRSGTDASLRRSPPSSVAATAETRESHKINTNPPLSIQNHYISHTNSTDSCLADAKCGKAETRTGDHGTNQHNNNHIQNNQHKHNQHKNNQPTNFESLEARLDRLDRAFPQLFDHSAEPSDCLLYTSPSPRDA